MLTSLLPGARDCFLPGVDGTNTQAESFEAGIYIPTFVQDADKGFSFRKGFNRVVQVLVGFSAVRYGFSNAGGDAITI